MFKLKQRLQAAWVGFNLRESKIWLNNVLCGQVAGKYGCDRGPHHAHDEQCTKAGYVCASKQMLVIRIEDNDHTHLCVSHLKKEFPELVDEALKRYGPPEPDSVVQKE
jgi:hypothetical protein